LTDRISNRVKAESETTIGLRAKESKIKRKRVKTMSTARVSRSAWSWKFGSEIL